MNRANGTKSVSLACANLGVGGKILSRIGDFGLLVECPMRSCKSAMVLVTGQTVCSDWLYKESIENLPKSLQEEIKKTFPQRQTGFLANRVHPGENEILFPQFSAGINAKLGLSEGLI